MHTLTVIFSKVYQSSRTILNALCFPYDARAYSQHAANQNDSFKKKLDC